MNRLFVSFLCMVSILTSLASALASESDWPRTVPLKQGLMTIYALQIDEKTENIIHFRAALAYRASADSEPVFGAGWFESPVEIDSANRIVHPTDLSLTETRFPAGTDEVKAEFSAALALQSGSWNLDFPLDELETALKAAAVEAQAINTSPPDIVYRDHPALLVSLDGEPILREVKDSDLKAVINTPYPLIFNGKYYYLNAAKNVWYRAGKATGPFKFDANPPTDIMAMVGADETSAEVEPLAEPVTAINAPEIVVSTVPTELIVTEGPAAFVPLVDDLLVLQNSQDDVFMHVSSQNFFIVLAGRWYRANSLNGPWSYAPADDLPAAFANIPRDSDQADSRVYVAGTEEARDAVLDSQVPQTAAVARGEADIDVSYDGEPIYEPVDGTDLVYIENTGSTVILAQGLYYLVENGVWYVSSSANGPWQVSDHRPAQVDTILPTSPVHNVKYVHVYDSTPSVVYVGYTPGYTGSYVYRNTVFYGTGWYYRPWVSPYYYYPRHSTWGFNVSYNSWSGWNFGLSWGWGPFSVSYYSGGYWHQNHYWHHRHYGRWGPGRYRHRPAHYGRGHNRYSHNGYDRGGRGHNDQGRSGGYRGNGGRDSGGRYASNANRSGSYSRDNNLYRDTSQRARVTNTRDSSRQANYIAATGSRQVNYTGSKKAQRNRTGPVSPSDLRLKADIRDINNEANRSRLLADNSGNVYRGAASTARRNDVVSRNENRAKVSKNRISPATPISSNSISPNISRANPGVQRNTRTPTGTSQQPSRNIRVDAETTRRTASAAVSPGQGSKTTKRSTRDQPRLSPTTANPARQTTTKSVNENARKRPTRNVSAPAERKNVAPANSPPKRSQSTRVVSASSNKQKVARPHTQAQRSPTTRAVSTPAKQQNVKRSGSQPRVSHNSAPRSAVTPKNSTRTRSNKSSGKQNGSKNSSQKSGSKRARG